MFISGDAGWTAAGPYVTICALPLCPAHTEDFTPGFSRLWQRWISFVSA